MGHLAQCADVCASRVKAAILRLIERAIVDALVDHRTWLSQLYRPIMI